MEIFTTITPWGKFHHQELKMGVYVSTDVLREAMIFLLKCMLNNAGVQANTHK